MSTKLTRLHTFQMPSHMVSNRAAEEVTVNVFPSFPVTALIHFFSGLRKRCGNIFCSLLLWKHLHLSSFAITFDLLFKLYCQPCYLFLFKLRNVKKYIKWHLYNEQYAQAFKKFGVPKIFFL